MARILYGVNGEGSGHSTRSKEVISHLIERGHEVHVASFDRGLQNLSRDFPGSPERAGVARSGVVTVTEIYGLRIAYVNNRVRYGRTVAKNLLNAPQAKKSMARLTELAREWRIDAVITDFEPLSCQLAKRLRLPIISINNQHLLTNCEFDCPREHRRDMAAAKLVTRCMTPGADAYIVISLFPAAAKKKDTFVFPPLLRREVLESRTSAGEDVLVYVTAPSPELVGILAQVRCRFTCYGFGREGQSGNLLFKKPSAEGFLRDLAGCKAVLANAGFSLLSEALHLGKPYLAVPVKHQFEQILNAYHVSRLGYGAYWEELNRERIESFLFNVEEYRERLQSYARPGNGALLAKVDELLAGLAAASARAASAP